MVGMVTAAVISRASSGSTNSSTSGEDAGFLDRDRVGQQPLALGLGLALDLVAALFFHRLRQHADVAHDGEGRPGGWR